MCVFNLFRVSLGVINLVDRSSQWRGRLLLRRGVTLLIFLFSVEVPLLAAPYIVRIIGETVLRLPSIHLFLRNLRDLLRTTLRGARRVETRV